MTKGRSLNPGGGVFNKKYILYESASSIDSLRNSDGGAATRENYELLTLYSVIRLEIFASVSTAPNL